MSEELIKSGDVEIPKESEDIPQIEKTQEVKKKVTTAKKKELEIIENYQYTPGKNEELIMDKPSVPLIENVVPFELNKKDLDAMKPQKPVVKSNKEIYESYVKELKNFSLSINNDMLYDSSIDKSKEFPIKFENDYFILYGKKYSYNGLRIQKINKK